MPKVELLGGMSYVEGWEEVADLVQQKMEEWGDELKDWTVRIRTFTKKDAKRSEQGDEDALSQKDTEKKVLTVAFKAEPVTHPEVEADMIMQDFVELEEEDEL